MRAWLTTGCIVSVGLLSGCGGSDTKTVTERVEVKTEQPSASSPATTGSGTPAPKIKSLTAQQEGTLSSRYSINDGPMLTHTFSARPISIAYDAAAPDPNTTFGLRLKTGYKWVKLRLRVRNSGKTDVLQSDFSWLLVDKPSGRRYKAYDGLVYQPQLGADGSSYRINDMGPGDVARGYLAFQVPVRGVATPRTLRMSEFSGSSGDTLEWNLTGLPRGR